MKLYFHPISSYSQKTLVAFYEKNAPFERAIVSPSNPADQAVLEQLYPHPRMPMLQLEDGEVLVESTTIIDYIDSRFPGGPQLIPQDRERARLAHHYDRIFDLYVNNQMVTILFDSFQPAAERAPKRVAAARDTLDRIYRALDRELAGRTWAIGEDFTLADCAAAPALGYAQRIHPFATHKNLGAYFQRLVERPSYARVVSEAAPYLARFLAERGGAAQ